MRESTFESLDIHARAALEKAQRAAEEGFFHYSRALTFSLLDRYPLCTPLRVLIRQDSVALKAPRANSLKMTLKTIGAFIIHLGGVRRPLKFLNDLERIIADAPDCQLAHQLFARVALENDYAHAASLSLETLCVLWPKLTHEQLLLARAYVRLDRNEEAQAIVSRILESNPHNDFASELLKQASVKSVMKTSNWSA